MRLPFAFSVKLLLFYLALLILLLFTSVAFLLILSWHYHQPRYEYSIFQIKFFISWVIFLILVLHLLFSIMLHLLSIFAQPHSSAFTNVRSMLLCVDLSSTFHNQKVISPCGYCHVCVARKYVHISHQGSKKMVLIDKTVPHLHDQIHL